MELGNMMFGNSRGEFHVNRMWQDAFVTKLYDMGFDGYGFPKNDESEYLGEFKEIKAKHYNDNARYFENETFMIMPYYWGDDDDISELPNFIHKPSGFKLSWYKYALRDSYMNKEITFDELMDIMKDCKNSLGANDIPYTYKEAIEKINDAIYWLDHTDSEEKTVEIVNELHRIIEKLEERER